MDKEHIGSTKYNSVIQKMKNDSVLIMVGGVSSRMKKSLSSSSLSVEMKEKAARVHKSLIPIEAKGKPLLYFLLKNVQGAGLREVYLITSESNEAFHEFLEENSGEFSALHIHFAVQKVPPGRAKPLGTADAVMQCLEQYPNLKEQRFSVCNGDNLYSSGALAALKAERNTPNALIAYQAKALGHPIEKIMAFALLDFDEECLLTEILEKPTKTQLSQYRARHSELWVSMNLFNFSGPHIFPALQNCPINEDRAEKELPTVVKIMLSEYPKGMICLRREEKVADLTSASDLGSIEGQLD